MKPLRNEREAHMALDCCKQNNKPHGCNQGDECPHWGRVSSNVKYMQEIRKPIPRKAAQVTPEQARDMDDTAGFGGVPDYVPGMMFFPNLAVKFRRRVGGVDWLALSRWAIFAVFVGACCLAIAGIAQAVNEHMDQVTGAFK